MRQRKNKKTGYKKSKMRIKQNYLKKNKNLKIRKKIDTVQIFTKFFKSKQHTTAYFNRAININIDNIKV